MNQKIISTIIIFSLITVIPTAYGQLSIGSEAKQELIEVKINPDGEIYVKHIVSSSNTPGNVPLVIGEISNLIITNDLGEEINSGTANDVKGNLSILVFPSKQNTVITYNLENMKLNNNLYSTEISYPKKISVLFDESVELIFVNDSIIFLENKKGIAVNGGGNAEIKFYNDESKNNFNNHYF